MPCKRQVTMRDWTMPTCLSPSSVQQKFPVLEAHGNDSQRVLKLVGTEWYVGVGQEHFQSRSPLARVIQGIDEWCCGPCSSSRRSIQAKNASTCDCDLLWASPCRRVASPVSLRRHGSPPLTQYGATKRSETAFAVDRARAQGVTKRTLRGDRELPLAAS